MYSMLQYCSSRSMQQLQRQVICYVDLGIPSLDALKNVTCLIVFLLCMLSI